MFYWFWKENLDKLPKKISPKRDIILIMIGAWILWIVYLVVDDILGDWCYGLEYLLYILIFNTVFVYKKKIILKTWAWCGNSERWKNVPRFAVLSLNSSHPKMGKWQMEKETAIIY